MSKNKNSNNNLPDRITVRANRRVGRLNKTKMAEQRKRGIKTHETEHKIDKTESEKTVDGLLRVSKRK